MSIKSLLGIALVIGLGGIPRIAFAEEDPPPYDPKVYDRDGFAAPSGTLPQELGAVFQKQTAARAQGDVKTYKETTSSRTLAELGGEFTPEKLKADFATFKDTIDKSPKQIGFKANEVCAILVQSELIDVDLAGLHSVGRGYQFIRFVKENTWKVDHYSLSVMVSTQPKLPEPPKGMVLFDKLPPLPVRSAKPDLTGFITATAHDSKVSITINGRKHDWEGGTYHTGFIAGGLKKGDNTIELSYEPKGPSKDPGIGLRIYAVDPKSGKKEVFKFESKEPRGSIKQTFNTGTEAATGSAAAPASAPAPANPTAAAAAPAPQASQVAAPAAAAQPAGKGYELFLDGQQADTSDKAGWNRMQSLTDCQWNKLHYAGKKKVTCRFNGQDLN